MESSVENISISDQIQTIGNGAFYKCENLVSIDLPSKSNLEVIEEKVCFGCPFDLIVIPPNVTKIGENAFAMRNQLEKLDVSNNSKLLTIGKDAFAQWKNDVDSIYKKLKSLKTKL